MAGLDTKIASLRLEEQEATAKSAASSFGLTFVNLVGYPIVKEVLETISQEEATTYNVVAYLKSGDTLHVATHLPPTDTLRRFLILLARKIGLTIRLKYCSTLSFTYVLNVYMKYHDEKKVQAMQESVKRGDEFIVTIKSIADITDQINKVSTSRLIDLLFAGGVLIDASDIHIEPTQEGARVRYRVDGILQDIGVLNLKQYHAVADRIKFLAKLKLDIAGAPQDGRFEMAIAGHTIDVRTSSLPASYGEDLVMRILIQDAHFLALEELNINPASLALIKDAIDQPHGMVINTGPTGSGKTTTLYAILSALNKPEVKVITIEDPVEYRLPGINQIQVNTDAGLTFAATLRSTLRQDPDIIMVGEIRDKETAQIALQAALTGHLVLSTLHANSAPAAIPRLLEMGIEPYLLAGSLNLIIAQRLVRKVCSVCKGADKACKQCGGSGFKGRIPVMETLKPTELFNELIGRKATIDEFERKARELGMQSMLEDGLTKVAAGLARKEEGERVSKDIETDSVAEEKGSA